MENNPLLEQKPRRRPILDSSSAVGLLFISPWIIGFILFKLIPILAALGFSFTNFFMLSPEKTQFIGMENYINILKDQTAGASLFGSIGEFLFVVPVEMIAALLLAVIFSGERLKNKRLLRTIFFLPSIIPAVTIFIIMDGLTNPRLGWINQFILTPLKLPPPNMGALFPIILSLWSIGPSFLIMLGAIQNVSREVYEAARVDGAGPMMRLFTITIPIISPAIFFSLVVNMTNAFGGVVLLDRGLPFSQSLSPMESYIASQMFSGGQLGYASALAWVMFVAVMVVVWVLFRSARYWVYFPEEEDNADF
jgi:multiple sugar transport system permease protein